MPAETHSHSEPVTVEAYSEEAIAASRTYMHVLRCAQD